MIEVRIDLRRDIDPPVPEAVGWFAMRAFQRRGIKFSGVPTRADEWPTWQELITCAEPPWEFFRDLTTGEIVMRQGAGVEG